MGKQLRFQERDAAEAPGGVGDFLDELGLSGCGGMIFVEELAAVVIVICLVFGGEDGRAGGQAVAESVERRFARFMAARRSAGTVA